MEGRIKKLVLCPILLGVACVLGGLYGAVHNQISFTVAPEYFHDFKFIQFEIPPAIQNRLGASIVGWRASWWMGLLIGTPVILVALAIPGWKGFLSGSLSAFVVVLVTAIAVGLIGLSHAAAFPMDATMYLFPPGVTDAAAFRRAGSMHNMSYVGGFVGILLAWVYLGRKARKVRRVARTEANAGQPEVSHSS